MILPFELAMFRSLKDHGFRWLWISGIWQYAAETMEAFSLAWLVLVMSDGSFTQLGFMIFLQGLAMMIFLLFGGVAADRFDRRKLLRASYLGLALTFAIIATLSLLDLIQLWHAYVASFVMGMGRAVNNPARMALLKDLVKRKNLMNAVSLTFVVTTIPMAFGAPVVGAIIDWVAIGFAFYAVSCCFLLASLSLFFIPKMVDRSDTPTATVGRDMLNGLKYAASSSAVRSVLILGFALAFIASPHNHMLPAFGKEVLGLGAAKASLLSMATGIGAVTGTLTLAALGDVRRKNILWLWLILIFVTALGLFAITPWLGLAMLFLALVGLGEMTFVSMGVTVLQLLVPREYVGRIMSIWGQAGSFMYLGSLPMGMLGELIGLRATLLGAALICLSLFLFLGVIRPTIRRIVFEDS